MTRADGAGLLSNVPANIKLILCLIHELHLGAQSPWVLVHMLGLAERGGVPCGWILEIVARQPDMLEGLCS